MTKETNEDISLAGENAALKQQIVDLEADVKMRDLWIEEVIKVRNDASQIRSGFIEENSRQAKEIFGLKDALEAIAEEAEGPQRFYDRNGPTWTSTTGNEYEDTCDYLDFANRIAELARKAPNGKPSSLRSELTAMADRVQEVAERNKELEEALIGVMQFTTLLMDDPSRLDEVPAFITARKTLKGPAS